MVTADDSINSSLRENVLEYLFISEILKALWLQGRRDIEISRSDVDSGGYDVVLDCNGVTRHIQLKTSFDGATTASQKISLGLMKKPSGCVVWFKFDKKTLELGPYHFFGGLPGSCLPDLSSYKIAKHSKGNAEGVKTQRPNHRMVPIGKFKRIESMDALVEALFGIKTDKSEDCPFVNLTPKSKNIEIVTIPNNEKSFKAALIENKSAYIALYKSDQTVEYKTWKISDFKPTSDLNNNLRSGPLRGWQKKGIVKAVFAIHEADL